MAEDAGSFLIRTGLIRRDELARLRASAEAQDATLLEVIVLAGRVDDETLTAAMRAELDLSLVGADDLARIPSSVVEAVPGELCAEHRLIPIALDGDRLTVAVSDPCDAGALDEVSFFTDTRVTPALATQLQVAWCLAHYYGVVTPLGETLLERPSPADAAPPGAGGASSPREPATPTDRDDAIELRPRAGEVVVRSESDATPASSRQDLPAVVLDDSVELRSSLRREGTGIPAPAGDDGDDSGVIVLTPDNRRRRSNTRLGLPPPAARVRRTADTIVDHEDDVVTEPGRYPQPTPDPDGPDTSQASYDSIENALENTIDGGTSAAPRPRAEDPAVPEVVGAAEDATVPTASARPAPRQAAAPRREADLPPAPHSEPVVDEDPDFGPPGTTIPPAFLGAVPSSYQDLDSGAIPIQAEDAAPDASQPHAVPRPEAPVAPSRDRYPELEAASTDLVRTLRALEGNTHRDAVIETLVAYAARRLERTALFVVKARTLVSWSSRGARAAEPTPLTDVPVLAAVVERGRPFRGAITDAPSRAFFEAWLAHVPDEILAVPVTVGERVVAVLYADTPTRRVYDEHIAVLARAAGDAFERVLRARKSL